MVEAGISGSTGNNERRRRSAMVVLRKVKNIPEDIFKMKENPADVFADPVQQNEE